jgi:hypothetical protein
MGDATTFIPVTNFDTNNVQVPRRENILRVRPTQLSGSSEARQMNFKADPPRRRPISNQNVSANRLARAAMPMMVKRFSRRRRSGR